MKLKELPDRAQFVSGDSACSGCMASNIAINVMRILGKKTIVSVPPCCLSVFGGTFPNLNWDVPYFHLQFANTASTVTGISRALKAQNKDDIVVLGMAGDGGTADIGLQALSGAAQRDENILYICYNNQAYENTGIQASGLTPYGSWSSTTPVRGKSRGNEWFPKDIPRILIAHEATYVATASTAFIQDFINKVEKAKKMKGFRYLEVLSVCTPGWKVPTHLGPQLAKEAVESGYWLLIEYENGIVKINRKPKFKGLEGFLAKQGRFKNITPEQVEKLKEYIDRRWKIYRGLEKATNPKET
ncbi:MAG: thiamine pyrophosphate-dependent enzyme [Candidatus Heimdallarchaeaceae archaeon]|uniref:Pyruvate synthase subunit beta n=1 Tax=Candidatus Heimdallarchaeum endolithica TaxID=2876572 RepID=A0A9Y1BRB2_9ARCH|nr:MAG: pyruvate synthase subunit beta [Candidatus Heimdallarchaeum endolithica]